MLPATNKAARDPASRDAGATAAANRSDSAESPSAGRNLAGLLASFRAPVATDTPAEPVAAGADQSHPAPVRVADQLRASSNDAVVLLHHRATPRVKPNIDHLAIAPSGVWVVHSRPNTGRVATRKPMFGEPRLTIGGRERSDLLFNLDRQVGYVRAALGTTFGDVQVRSAVCFVDTEAPLVRILYLGSYLFFGVGSVVKHLNSPGPCSDDRIQAIAALLEEKFPAA